MVAERTYWKQIASFILKIKGFPVSESVKHLSHRVREQFRPYYNVVVTACERNIPNIHIYTRVLLWRLSGPARMTRVPGWIERVRCLPLMSWHDPWIKNIHLNIFSIISTISFKYWWHDLFVTFCTLWRLLKMLLKMLLWKVNIKFKSG